MAVIQLNFITPWLYFLNILKLSDSYYCNSLYNIKFSNQSCKLSTLGILPKFVVHMNMLTNQSETRNIEKHKLFLNFLVPTICNILSSELPENYTLINKY